MQTLTIPAPVWALVQTLEQAGYETWAVGGCVRDSLLGRRPHDWDLTTAAQPAQMLVQLPQAIPTGLIHGTVTVPTEAGPIELTTFRAETGYADHRRPDAVRFLTEVEGDLARRDFTVNAMAWHPTRGLRDPFGGRIDLAAHILRCVGDPDRRFAEDALRMLRALRFAARLDAVIEPATAAAMERHAPELCYVAHERIYTELRGLLAAKGAALGEQFPQLLTAAVSKLPLPGSKRALRTWRTQLGDADLDRLLHWCSSYGGQDIAQASGWLTQLRAEERTIRLDIDGAALMALGIPPGPAMGAVLNRLRRAVEDGEVENRREALERHVQNITAEWPESHGSATNRNYEG